MKRLSLLLILLSSCAFGQSPPVHAFEPPRAEPINASDNVIFIGTCDAKYPGGIVEMRKHVQSYTFDVEWLDSLPQKRGYVSFIVEADGRLMDIEIVRGISPELDDIMLRIVEEMPRWIPGCNGHHPVRSRVRLPITFVRAQ